MKLTVKMYDRINRRKHYRVVRWSIVGNFHLVDISPPPSPPTSAMCGVRFGPLPERYIPEEHKDPHVCEECWALFTGAASQTPRLL